MPGAVIQNLQAALDAEGCVHVIYEDWGGGPNRVRLGHVVIGNGSRRAELIHPAYIASEPALGTRPNGNLVLIFWGTPEMPNDRSRYRMFLSELK